MPIDYNPKLPEVIADPFPILRRLQREDPVHWNPILRGWVLTRYDHVKSSLNDPRLSADRITPFVEHQGRDGMAALRELGRAVGLWAVFTDPPAHTRLRSLMNKVLTPRAVERLRPRIRSIIDGLLDDVQHAGRLDLIRDFAYPLPLAVIADLIGVPAADRDRLKMWSDDLAAFIGSAVATPDKYGRASVAMQEMSEYFRRLAALRSADPRDDIMSGLLVAHERGETLTEDEVISTCILLLFAGHETTTNVIGNGLLALLRNREQYDAWRRDPSLTPTAVEELLRYDGPGQGLVRVAADSFELDGTTINRGDRVFLMVNAANRDPRHFHAPDRLDLRRHDNRHLTFGHGIHFCLGAPLARLEAQLALPAILERLPELELVTDHLEWLDSLIFRGVKSLPLAFHIDTV